MTDTMQQALAALLENFEIGPDLASVVNKATGRRYPFTGQRCAAGHYYIRIGKSLVDVGRAIFALTYKCWPNRLQRKDGNVFNNHISNLVDLVSAPAPPVGQVTSPFIGVHPYPNNRSKPWRVSLYYKRASYTLGYYPTDTAAARAYDRMVSALILDDAALNFPREPRLPLSAVEKKAVTRVMFKMYPSRAHG